MFEGIEIAARRIWALKTNRSSLGNILLSRYTPTTSSIASCHTRKSR
jgi:hypothetical protein